MSRKNKTEENTQSYCIDSGRYCIADELIHAGFKEKYPKLRECGGYEEYL